MNAPNDGPRCGKMQAWGMGYRRCDRPAGHDEHNFVSVGVPKTMPTEERVEAAADAALGKTWAYLSTKKKRALCDAMIALISTSASPTDEKPRT